MLEFPENSRAVLRERYDLANPGRLEDALQMLEDWIQKQPHFIKKDFKRVYLETCLITCKGSMERTKNRIEKLCTLKTLLPEYFTYCNPNELAVGLEKFAGGLLPKMGYDYNRIVILKDIGFDFSSEYLRKLYKYIIYLAEYLRANDYSDGYIIVLDLTTTNILDAITNLNLLDLRNFITLLIEGYGLRLKGFHFIVAPTTLGRTVDMILSIFKNFLTDKLANRLYAHKSIEAIYQYIPQEIMTVEYGGKENYTLSELQEKWKQVLGSQETIDYLIEMSRAGVDESYKKTDKFYEQHFGLPGSFRKLDLD